MVTVKSCVQRRPKFRYIVAPLSRTDKTLPSTSANCPRAAAIRSVWSDRKGAKLGSAQSPRRAVRALRSALNSKSAQALSPILADTRSLTLLEHRFLKRLVAAVGINKGNDAAVAVPLAAELFELHVTSFNERLQRVTADVGDLDRSQSNLAAIGKQQRASVADVGHAARTRAGQIARSLRRQNRDGRARQNSHRQNCHACRGQETLHELETLRITRQDGDGSRVAKR